MMDDITTFWDTLPSVVDARPAEYETAVYGISRIIRGNEVIVDFGDTGEIAMAEIVFRDRETAKAAYCKGLRLSIKVVEHPEQKLVE